MHHEPLHGHAVSSRRERFLKFGYRNRLFVFPRTGPPLHAMLTSCGFQRATGRGYDWDGLARGQAPFVVFQWTTSGCGLLTWEGRDWHVGADAAMVVRIPHAHRYRVCPDADHWEFVYVCLTGREILRVVGEVESSLGPVLPPGAGSWVATIAGDVLRWAFSGQQVSACEASALAYSLAMGLLSQAGPPGGTAGATAATAAAAAYCRTHVGAPLGVAALARLCRLSPYYFCRLFRREQGMTPAAYRLHHQVRAAMRLLRETHLSVKEIALESGFAEPNYFGKVFRRHLGVSPGQFRRSGM